VLALRSIQHASNACWRLQGSAWQAAHWSNLLAKAQLKLVLLYARANVWL
jgi:hypothetical protein